MRTLIALAALATSATLFAGSATEAFAGTPGYRLVPATAFSAANTVVARDVLWKCAGEACVATKATSRPEIVCASAARERFRPSRPTARTFRRKNSPSATKRRAKQYWHRHNRPRPTTLPPSPVGQLKGSRAGPPARLPLCFWLGDAGASLALRGRCAPLRAGRRWLPARARRPLPQALHARRDGPPSRHALHRLPLRRPATHG